MNLNEYRKKVAVVINEYVKEHGYDEVKTNGEIIKLLKDKIGEVHVMFLASDMCYNVTNKANLKSYPKDILVFEKKGRGSYRLLGENYKYNGNVMWRKKGDKKITEVPVGIWEDGKLDYKGDSFV